MSLSSPHRTTGEMITASIWNTDFIDPLNSLPVSSDGLTWQGRIVSQPIATVTINQSYTSTTFAPVINKAGAGVHPSLISLVIEPPVIGGGAATVTNASTLVVNGAPTAGASNTALLVTGSGLSSFQGPLLLYTGTNMGITFDDTRISGVVVGSIGAYLGGSFGNFLLRVTTDSPLHLGSNNLDLLKIRKDNITINLGAADLEYLTFESTDVAHGFTSDTATAAFANIRKASATAGGLSLAGYSESVIGVYIPAGYTTGTTVKTTSAEAAIVMCANKLTGTTAGAMGANENILVLRNNVATKFIFDAEGDLLYDGDSPANYDAWDDVALTRALDQTLRGPDFIETEWDEFVHYHKRDLVRAGIISEGGFVNLTRHSRLLNGAIWQLFQRLESLAQRVAQLESVA